MNAIESLFDDPDATDDDDEEERAPDRMVLEQLADDPDGPGWKPIDQQRGRARPAPPAPASPAVRRVELSDQALPIPGDVDAWRRLAAPIIAFLEEAPRTIVAVKLRGAQVLPRFEGRPITDEVIAFLLRRGAIAEFRRFDGKAGYKIAGARSPRRPRQPGVAGDRPTAATAPTPIAANSPTAAPAPPAPKPEEKPMPKSEKTWISTAAAAELLGTHPNRLHQLLSNGRIESRGERREREWEKGSIEKYIAERGERKPRGAKTATPPPEIVGARDRGQDGAPREQRRRRRARPARALADRRLADRAARRGRSAQPDRGARRR